MEKQKNKIHYATLISQATEDNNYEEWSDSICGKFTENVDDDWNCVTCKICLKLKERHIQEMRLAMDIHCKQMGDMADFWQNEIMKETN